MDITRDIVKEIQNFEGLDDKMSNLKRRMEYLVSREEDVRTELDYADSLPMKKRRKTVENWLTNIGKMKKRVQQLEQEVTERRFYNYLQLQKTIDKVTEEVKELIQLGAFPDGLTVVAGYRRGLPLPTSELVGKKFQERKNMIEEIITRNDNSLCIGIYGMGGVGKTTLVQHIYNDLLNHPNSSVFWVVVSQNFSIHKLQKDIANLVQADFADEDDVHIRALILAKALKGIINPVLILDDLWNDFPLENVGIVKGGGCKLVFTTRSLKVCHKMESNIQIKVDTLLDEEAWELFMKTLGTCTPLTPQIIEIAKSLVKECDGLPLGLITVAGSMRGVDDICEWRNALETLRQATGEQDDNLQLDKIFRVLRYSYDMLKNQTLQECFLYCSLYPEDHEIIRGELIANFIDEGLISRMGSRQAEFDRGHTILNILENVCLLQGGITQGIDNLRYMKMHDLLRDMALRIACESSRFLVEAGVGIIHKIEDEKWSESLERVSFYGRRISRSLSSSVSPPFCPKLSTLMLRACINIPDSFFMHMIRLTVLDLSETDLVNLPSSISNLKNLNALLLSKCRKLAKFCPLSDLRALKRLDLSGTRITELPEGMDLLTNLKDLSLFGANNLKMIPEGILPRLSHLQRLQLPTYGGRAKVRGEEIASLEKLETFKGRFYNINELDRCLSSWVESSPSDYQLLVGEGSLAEVKHLEMEKVMHITKFADFFTLCQLESMKKAIDFRICIVDNCRMTHLFCSSCYNLPSIPYLVSLKLKNLWNAHDLLWGRRCSSSSSSSSTRAVVTPTLPTSVFSSLKEFTIEGCPKIKKLFTPAMLSHLQKLETFIVSHCVQLEEIVQVPKEDQDQDQRAIDSIIFNTLPKLKVLKLVFLLKLKSFCSSRKLVSDSLKKIFIQWCPMLERFPLLREDSHPPTSLECITVDKNWWESIDFDRPDTKEILKPICHFHLGTILR